MLTLTLVAALAAAEASIIPVSEDAAIEEIIVTSRYRAEKLSDVPDSITAFTAQDIERHRIERINRIASLTPNLRFSDDQEVGVSTLVIRGVTQNRGTGQPPVSFRIDGVSATNNLLTTQELFDIESVDVLRGPQGALYGRNAIGGAVLISTRRPTTDPEFNLRFSAAEGKDYTLAGSASGPLAGSDVALTLKLKTPEQARQTALLLQKAGAGVNQSENSLEVSGDLGQILASCLEDADAMYINDGPKISSKYGYDERRVMYNWWTAAKEVDKDLKKQKKFKEAKSVTDLKKKGIELAYNYYKIEPQKIGDRYGIVIFSLVFYVIYTLWYGFAIMYMFEGWGMQLEH